MTSKDSSGDKLVATIRKTKAGVASRSRNDSMNEKSGLQKATVKKTVSKKKAVARPIARQSDSNKPKVIDLFQSGGRVWPD